MTDYLSQTTELTLNSFCVLMDKLQLVDHKKSKLAEVYLSILFYQESPEKEDHKIDNISAVWMAWSPRKHSLSILIDRELIQKCRKVRTWDILKEPPSPFLGLHNTEREWLCLSAQLFVCILSSLTQKEVVMQFIKLHALVIKVFWFSNPSHYFVLKNKVRVLKKLMTWILPLV